MILPFFPRPHRCIFLNEFSHREILIFFLRGAFVPYSLSLKFGGNSLYTQVQIPNCSNPIRSLWFKHCTSLPPPFHGVHHLSKMGSYPYYIFVCFVVLETFKGEFEFSDVHTTKVLTSKYLNEIIC